MKLITKSGLLLAHRIILFFVCMLVFVVGGFYAYEANFDYRSSKIDYYAVISTKLHYEFGDDINFYSFNMVHEPVDMEWKEIVYCAKAGDTTFDYHDETEYEDSSYYKEKSYPEYLTALFSSERDHLEYGARYPLHFDRNDEALRNYGDNTNMASWRLTVDQPENGSQCYTKHSIIYRTERLKLERTQIIYSNIWTYGDA